MSPTRVLVAGGGVAGVEALLALSALGAERVNVRLLSPSEKFVYRPLQVVEAFGSADATALELGRIVADVGAVHERDALSSVDPEAGTVTTASGAAQGYDALLIALGARPVEAIPGALTFGANQERARFAELLSALGRRGTKRLAFVIPPQATWSIAAYELALLTAAECDARRLEGVEISLVTSESAPLEIFGDAASELVARQLEEAGVSLRTSSTVERARHGRLALADGESLEADRVVALPRLEVDRISGLPQSDNGFVETDARMQVSGLENVWAAGDVTVFPIKQGGLAAQQADVAAQAIAARAGAGIPVEPFEPVLRGELITGGTPDFLRMSPDDPGGGVATSGAALWSPAVKLAGRYLAPYLAGARHRSSPGELADVAPPEDPARETQAHERAVELVLSAADADAGLGRFDEALRWLSLIEELNLVLPPAYVTRRYEWRRALDPDAEPDAATKRIDPSFGSAADAISDLQRRLGWLREIERRGEGEMRAELDAVEAGIGELEAAADRMIGFRDPLSSGDARENQASRAPTGDKEEE